MRGSIRKHGKHYGVVFDDGRDPVTGKRKQRWVGKFKSRRGAQAYLNTSLPQVQDGVWTPPSKERFGDFVTRWLRDYAAATVRPTTLSSYRMIAEKHLTPEFGPLTLTGITPQRIQQYFTAKVDAGLSSTTVRHHAMLLHRVLRTAVREGLLAQNPADRVDLPRNRSADVQTLDTERTQLFLGAAKHSPLYALFLVTAFTGLRMGEVCGLRWRDVNLTLGTATVVQTVYRLYGNKAKGEATQLLFGEPKSRQSRRTVPLPPPIPDELRALRSTQDEQRRVLGDDYQDADLVFAQATGRPLHPSDVRKEFHRVVRVAGLPRIRFHDLRHGAASLRLAQGDSPKVVQELLGHASAAFTLQVYGHLLPGAQEDSARRLAERLLGVREQSVNKTASEGAQDA